MSLATVCQSLNSLPMDNYRRMAFSEEVVAYLDAAVINSHVILAYLCVWAGERLCGGGRAGTVLPALSPPRPTQSRHRTHLPIYCQWLSSGRATPETTKLSRLYRVWRGDVNWVLAA